MRFFLLRHGETDWNLQGRCQGVTDLDLNETGRRQAAEIAEYLSRERIKAIYSSDLRRALHTAQEISRSRGLQVRVDRDFRELNHGEFEGLTFPDIRASHPDFVGMWRSEPAELLIPGGERLVDVARRAWSGMERIARSHLSHETIVVVSHHFPILAILCRITGTPLNRCRSFHVDPCGLSDIRYNDNDGWSVREINGAGASGLAVPRGGLASGFKSDRGPDEA